MNHADPTNKTCPECGAALSDSAPSAPCHACLMKLGLQAWSAGGPGATVAPTIARSYADPDDAEFNASVLSEGPLPPEIQQLAAAIPQYEIMHLVGQGGMGSVYCAKQKSLNRLVALKVIKPAAQKKVDFAERFAREARALAQLNHHNIITVHDFGETDGTFYFVMEYVDGINLRQMLQGQRLTPAQALEIVPAICDALQYAHDKGIVHRDIKPDNILIDTNGHVKIADFGLAKLLDEETSGPTLTQAHQVMGTMHYMAPEQIEKPLSVDHRADIYSLGVIFYELLTGELPLGRFAPPSRKVEVDIRLDEIVLHTLEKEPSLRYQRVSEIKTDMESVAAGTYVSANYDDQQSPVPVHNPAARVNPNQPEYIPPPNAPVYAQGAAHSAARNAPQGLNADERYAQVDFQEPVPPVKTRFNILDDTRSSGPIARTGFFKIVKHPQPYRNLLYLLLSFPLGVIYFVLQVLGLSLGLGTLILWIGPLVLIAMFFVINKSIDLERFLANWLLNIQLPPRNYRFSSGGETLMQRVKGLFTNRQSYIGFVYLLVKFPLGIVSFVFFMVSLSFSISMMITPILYFSSWSNIQIGGWRAGSLLETIPMALTGAAAFVLTLHVLSYITWLHAKWARICLGRGNG